MCPESSKDKSLVELGLRWEILKESVNECISTRDFYICRNEVNEMELKRLIHIKENLAYLKDVLLQDLYKSNVNAGKGRKLLSKRLKEYNKISCSVKLHSENLPVIIQLKELVQYNEQLLSEHLRWTKMLENLKKEYKKVFHNLENNLKMKIIEFSKELAQLLKGKGYKHNNLQVNNFI